MTQPTSKSTDDDRPVVERLVQALSAGGEVRDVTLCADAPVRDPLPGGDFRCAYRVVGLVDDTVHHAHGVDTMQALLLAVRGLELVVTEQAAQLGLRLTWHGHNELALSPDSLSSPLDS